MVYEFEITSEEKSDFSRMIKIKEDQTFLDFHEAIQRSVGYDDSQLASFYTLDKKGMRVKEISLFEMEDEEDDIETYVMDVTMIREVVSDKTKKLLYVFDFFGDRSFSVSFVGKEDEELIAYPVCTFSEGDAPVQMSENDDEDDYSDDDSYEDDKYDDDYYSDDYDDDDIIVGKAASKKKVAPASKVKKVKKSSLYDDDRDPYMSDDVDFDDDLDAGVHFENLDDYDDLL